MLFVAGFSAFAVFLGIASIGFLFLVISFLFGEFFGHGDLGGHDADFHGDVHADAGVSIFSTRVLSVFVTAFGGFGAIGIHLGYGTEVSTALGVAGGLVFGSIIYLFASFLFSQQASSEIRMSELCGGMAHVSVAIPKGGVINHGPRAVAAPVDFDEQSQGSRGQGLVSYVVGPVWSNQK